MLVSEEGLSLIEQQAGKMKNVKLMFLVQILREIRELRDLLEVHQESGNGSYSGANSTDNCENKHG